MTESIGKKRITLWILVLITFCGMMFRLISCFWGYPLALHPDELTIVDNAIDMLRRHSWLAYVYNRPDQFEIKCNAALFAAASRVLFRAPAYEAFETHYMAFYVIARGFTALFGTAMIPLAGILAGRMVREERQRYLTQIATAFVIAFSPILVEHSAYATPDIVLTFFILLFTLLAQCYLETGKTMYLWSSVLVTGIGITIKYPAAILCAVVAAMVIFRSVRERKFWNIVRYGMISIALLAATVFVIAPNLFTDFSTVYETLVFESRPNHLGADGLGWAGNIRFYLETTVRDLEWFSLIFAGAGILWAVRNRSERTAVLLIGPFYLVCISALSLHWVQWGIPGYVYYDMLTALGVSGMVYWLHHARRPEPAKKFALAACAAFAGILGLSLFLSAAGTARSRLLEDTRSISLRYCTENGINTGNSIFEGYTPLSPNGAAGYRYYAFHIKDGKACINEPYATKQYFITSDSYSGRFLAESEQYPDQAEIYRAIPESYEKVYEVNGGNGYSRKALAIQNIPYSVRFFMEEPACTGSAIYIYDLSPERVTLETASEAGRGISLENGLAVISDTPDHWVIYSRDDGKISLLCAENNTALGCNADGQLVTVEPEDENECVFAMQDQNGNALLSTDRGCLTREGETLMLLPAETQNASQEWRIVPADKEKT